jgi:hypothetical protein
MARSNYTARRRHIQNRLSAAEFGLYPNFATPFTRRLVTMARPGRGALGR